MGKVEGLLNKVNEPRVSVSQGMRRPQRLPDPQGHVHFISFYILRGFYSYEIFWRLSDSSFLKHSTHHRPVFNVAPSFNILLYVEIKCQLDATEVFIADLIACSTCFGHHCAHHQELKSIIQWLLPVVFRAVVFQVAGLVWS